MAFLDEKDGDLITYWKTKTGITDLVGTTMSAKIWPYKARQGTTGYHIIFEQGDGGESYRNLGAGSPLRRAVVHVYAMAATRSNADALAEAVRQETENYRGDMGSTYVHDVLALPPDSGTDDPTDDSPQQRYWTRIVYEITHAVTAAN